MNVMFVCVSEEFTAVQTTKLEMCKHSVQFESVLPIGLLHVLQEITRKPFKSMMLCLFPWNLNKTQPWSFSKPSDLIKFMEVCARYLFARHLRARIFWSNKINSWSLENSCAALREFSKVLNFIFFEKVFLSLNRDEFRLPHARSTRPKHFQGFSNIYLLWDSILEHYLCAIFSVKFNFQGPVETVFLNFLDS